MIKNSTPKTPKPRTIINLFTWINCKSLELNLLVTIATSIIWFWSSRSILSSKRFLVRPRHIIYENIAMRKNIPILLFVVFCYLNLFILIIFIVVILIWLILFHRRRCLFRFWFSLKLSFATLLWGHFVLFWLRFLLRGRIFKHRSLGVEFLIIVIWNRHVASRLGFVWCWSIMRVLLYSRLLVIVVIINHFFLLSLSFLRQVRWHLLESLFQL